MRGHCSARGQIGTVPLRASLAGPAWALHNLVGWVSFGKTVLSPNIFGCHIYESFHEGD